MQERKIKIKNPKITNKLGKGLFFILLKIIGFSVWLIKKRKVLIKKQTSKNQLTSFSKLQKSPRTIDFINKKRIVSRKTTVKTNSQRKKEKFQANHPIYQKKQTYKRIAVQQRIRKNKYRQNWSWFFSLATILILVFIFKNFFLGVGAATYTWVQSDWSGDSSNEIANHPTNQSSWNKYESKDVGVFAGSHISLEKSNYSALQTSNDGSVDNPNIGGFDSGEFSNVVATNTGNNTKLEIANSIKEISFNYPEGPVIEEALIREDCTGHSNCYNSLNAWENAFGGIDFGVCSTGDLVCANKIAVAKIDGSWSGPEENTIVVSGWETGPNNYIKIYTTAESRHNGNFKKEGMYYINKQSWGTQLTFSEAYGIIDGLAVSGEGASGSEGIRVTSSVNHQNDSEIKISNCLVYNAPRHGIAINSPNTIKAWNNIIYESGSSGLNVGDWGQEYNAHFYNNTSYSNGGTGIHTNNGTRANTDLRLKNNLSYGNSGSDYNTLSYIDEALNNLSGDGTSPSGISYQNKTISFVSTAPGFEDLHLSHNDIDAIDQGINLSTDPYLNFSTDIDSLGRINNWDIGADEYWGLQSGEFTSSIIDLGSLSSLNDLTWDYNSPEKTTIRLEVAGNDNNETWNYYPIVENSENSEVIQIYRSVGFESTEALATGNENPITISNSIATFESDLADKIGVGDVIQYDSTGNGTVDSLAFIHKRFHSKKYLVKQIEGSSPIETSENTDWQLFRAYTSVYNAEAGIENIGIDSSLRNFDNWTTGGDSSTDDIGKDLVGANQQWNIACYDDNPDDSMVSVEGWTTSNRNFVRIFTPVSSDEVGISQRHNGIVNGVGYLMKSVNENSQLHNIALSENHTVIEGVKIERTNQNWSYGSAILVSATTGNQQNDYMTIKDCLLYQSSGGDGGSLISISGASSKGRGHKVKNNILVSNSDNLHYGIFYSRSYDTLLEYQSYFYNNTVYGKFTYEGFHLSVSNTPEDTYKPLIKNNYVANIGDGIDFSLNDEFSNELENFSYNACNDQTCGSKNFNQTISLSQADFIETTPSTANLHLNTNSLLRLKGIGPDNDAQVLNLDTDWHPRVGSASDVGADQFNLGNRAKTKNEFFMQGYRYVKFKVLLESSDNNSTPHFDSLAFDYFQYPLLATLTSSIYDSGDIANTLASLKWSQSNTSSTETVSFQLRTSPDGTSWTDWLGPTSNSDYYENPRNNSVNSAHSDTFNDRFFQYKAFLNSNGSATPVIHNITTTYVVNAPPEFESAPTASMNNDGEVNISYSVRDPDTTEGSSQPGFITPSFEYSLDNGATWNAINSGLSLTDKENKSVEESNYTTHNAIWQVKDQLNENYSNQAKIRITIDDGEAANNITSSQSNIFTLDTTNPTNLVINIDSSSNPAILNLSATDSSSLEMLIGLEENLSDEAWKDFSSSSTISLATTPDTVYVKFRDIYGNETPTISATTPHKLENVMIQDTSNVLTSPVEYRLFVAWEKAIEPVPGFGSYRIYRSQDQSSWNHLATISDIETNYFGDSTVLGDTPYYYKINLIDATENISVFSNVVNGNANGIQDAGEGGGGLIIPDPLSSISGISNPPSVITDKDALITFNTDQSANCRINYGTSEGNYEQNINEEDYNKNHGITLTELSANTEYFYQINCQDSFLNDLTSSEYTFVSLETQYSEDEYLSNLPPLSIISQISNPPAVVTDEKAIITFQTDQSANCRIDYGLSNNDYSFFEIEINYNYSHAITFSSLTPGTEYFYQINCEDRNENQVSSTEKVFTTLEVQYSEDDFEANQEPLSIISEVSDPPKILTDEEVVITFKTNQGSTCTLDYGIDKNNYMLSEIETSRNTLHAIVIENLSPKTTYYYKITCADANDNTVVSDQYSFITQERLFNKSELSVEQNDNFNISSISSIKVSDVTGEGAKITWVTDEVANSLVRYASDEKCLENETCGRVAGNAFTNSSVENYSTNHTVFIDGLIPGTKYFYIVTSINALGQVSKSSQRDFITASFSAISSIKVSDITLTNATINWESSREVSSILEYGTDSGYGNKIESSELKKNHSVTLSDLEKGTNYHFLVKGRDTDKKYFSSSDHTFTTNSPPVIENPSVLGVKEDQAQVKFMTSIPTGSLIVYQDVTTETGSHSGSQGNPSLSKNHDILLKNLHPGITYNLKIHVNDEEGNKGEASIDNFTTLKDETPPQISHIKTESALNQDNQVQTIISWKTNERTGSILKIKSASDEEKILPGSENPSTSHVAIITSLKPGSVYNYKITAKDQAGNETSSSDYVILTPQKKENIIQIIITQFQEIFGWTKIIGN